MAAEGISQLHLSDSCSSGMEEDGLLKKLLTGQMDQGEVRRNEQQVIDDRSRGLQGTLDLSDLSGPGGWTLGGEPLGLDDNDQGIALNLLGPDSGATGNRIWQPSSPRHDLMSNELDEILQEQMRQEDLWIQSYFDDSAPPL